MQTIKTSFQKVKFSLKTSKDDHHLSSRESPVIPAYCLQSCELDQDHLSIDNTQSYIRHYFPWLDKPQTDHCVIPISLEQSSHTGVRFKKLIDYAKRNFSKITLIIPDTLHRHNASNDSESGDSNFEEKCREVGKVWVDRHDSMLKNLGAKLTTLIYWDNYLNHASYAKARDLIDTIYNTDPLFMKCVKKSAGAYIKRKYTREMLASQWENLIHNAINYKLEEIAVLLLWDFSHILYPTSLGSDFDYILNIIHRINPQTLNSRTPVKESKRHKALIAQCEAIANNNNIAPQEKIDALKMVSQYSYELLKRIELENPLNQAPTLT